MVPDNILKGIHMEKVSVRLDEQVGWMEIVTHLCRPSNNVGMLELLKKMSFVLWEVQVQTVKELSRTASSEIIHTATCRNTLFCDMHQSAMTQALYIWLKEWVTEQLCNKIEDKKQTSLFLLFFLYIYN